MAKWIGLGVLVLILLGAFIFVAQSLILGALSVVAIVAPIALIKFLPGLSKKTKALLVGITVFVLAIILQHPFVVYFTARSEIVVINGVANKTLKAGDKDRYMVYTDKGVFMNDDCPLWLKWSSSDFQDQFFRLARTGIRVRFYYYDWRIRSLSWYPNVYKFEVLGDEAISARFILESVPDNLLITGRVVAYTELENKIILTFENKNWSEIKKEIGHQKYDEVMITAINSVR